MFTTVWKLYETLPVNENTASLLYFLGGELVPIVPHDMDVMKVIARWNVNTESKYDRFEGCRSNIARLISGAEFRSLKDSKDSALRK